MTPRAKAEPDMLLRINVAARRLGLSRRAIYYMIEDGRLRAVRLGTRCLRIRASELESFMRRNTTSGEPRAVSRGQLAPQASDPMPGAPN